MSKKEKANEKFNVEKKEIEIARIIAEKEKEKEIEITRINAEKEIEITKINAEKEIINNFYNNSLKYYLFANGYIKPSITIKNN
jgi:outer membrane PBP1 activator LpoA protein